MPEFSYFQLVREYEKRSAPGSTVILFTHSLRQRQQKSIRTTRLTMAEPIGVVGLASGLATVANLYHYTATIYSRYHSDQNTWNRKLFYQIKDTEQSLRMLGELLMQTKSISESDLAIAIRIYWSAVTQITVVKQGTAARYFQSMDFQPMTISSRVSRPFRQTESYTEVMCRQAWCEVNTVSKDVEILRRILIMYVRLFMTPEGIANDSKRLLGWSRARSSSQSLNIERRAHVEPGLSNNT